MLLVKKEDLSEKEIIESKNLVKHNVADLFTKNFTSARSEELVEKDSLV